jgi:hypothetical protein
MLRQKKGKSVRLVAFGETAEQCRAGRRIVGPLATMKCGKPKATRLKVDKVAENRITFTLTLPKIGQISLSWPGEVF